jgi:hypothetical protein
MEDEARERQRIADQAVEKERARIAEEARVAQEKADAAREAGKPKLAAQFEQKAAVVAKVADDIVAPVVKAEIPKNVRGAFSTAKRRKAVIKSKILLLKYCVESNNLHLVDPNMVILNDFARKSKEPSDIPGVEYVEE